MLAILSGCTGHPDGVQPVANFDLNRYLGVWYEIARLDHRFERGLSRVSAMYTLRDDGGVDVLNRGFDKSTGKWQEAKGKAYFIGQPTVASLKVSFFGPFTAATMSWILTKTDIHMHWYAVPAVRIYGYWPATGR